MANVHWTIPNIVLPVCLQMPGLWGVRWLSSLLSWASLTACAASLCPTSATCWTPLLPTWGVGHRKARATKGRKRGRLALGCWLWPMRPAQNLALLKTPGGCDTRYAGYTGQDNHDRTAGARPWLARLPLNRQLCGLPVLQGCCVFLCLGMQ